MLNSYIYDIVRIPTGKKGGYYKSLPVENAAAFLINSIIARNKVLADLSELILSNSIGTMGNMARYSALLSQLKQSTLSSTIDLQCGGAYQALRFGSSLVQSGQIEAVLVGGIESNSLRPERRYHENDPRRKNDGDLEVADFNPFETGDLNISAHNLAKQYKVLSEELNLWTMRSHRKAQEFSNTEVYDRYVLDPENLGRKDQTIRFDLSMNLLERASAAGYINNSNTAHYHDGVCIALLGGEGLSLRHGLKPMARIRHVEIIGIDPGEAPFGAIIGAEHLLEKNEIKLSEIDLFEVNESYGVKPLAFMKRFKTEPDKVNIIGGNLAFGHPYAASGMMNLMHLILSLKQESKRFGLLSAGVAGGFGAAVLVENLT